MSSKGQRVETWVLEPFKPAFLLLRLRMASALVGLCVAWSHVPAATGVKCPQRLEPHELKYYEKIRSVVDRSPGELVKAVPELKGLKFANSQEELAPTLRRVGEGVEKFLRDFPNTASLEGIRRERLDRGGNVMESEDQIFHYLVLGRQGMGEPGLDEFRTDAKGKRLEARALQGPSLLTSGFASLSVHLHPRFQPGSAFRFLGRQVMEGRETYVVAFAQRPDVGRVGGRVEYDGKSGTILVQGVAWIDPASHQIIQMRLDLLAPRPDLGVERQVTQLRFGKIEFRQVPSALWLPREVVVSLESDGQIFRNRHRYFRFRLFSVEADQKPKGPESTPQGPKNEN